MRVPRIRFRLRTLMLLVLAVGLVTGLGIQAMKWRRLSVEYRARAAMFTAEANQTDVVVAIWKNMHEQSVLDLRESRATLEVAAGPSGAGVVRWVRSFFILPAGSDNLEFMRRRVKVDEAEVTEMEERIRHYSDLAEHLRSLAKKYERASHRPWIPVAPDPPEPMLK